ncbi:uncharacterized protein G2W53_034434 [Senna tora]|uniref:Uncharacterized protein n=1 Tax=Senna tora TaxID=362788 RepID=A0A834SZB4_9FABA|nr:uncharacterized protein G2W53_034434 [Senna tora]
MAKVKTWHATWHDLLHHKRRRPHI